MTTLQKRLAIQKQKHRQTRETSRARATASADVIKADLQSKRDAQRKASERKRIKGEVRQEIEKEKN